MLSRVQAPVLANMREKFAAFTFFGATGFLRAAFFLSLVLIGFAGASHHLSSSPDLHIPGELQADKEIATMAIGKSWRALECLA